VNVIGIVQLKDNDYVDDNGDDDDKYYYHYHHHHHHQRNILNRRRNFQQSQLSQHRNRCVQTYKKGLKEFGK
jgi:hypothetical protein